MAQLITSRQTADANRGQGARIMKPTNPAVRRGLEAFTKTLRNLRFYDVGKDGAPLARNNEPIRTRKDQVQFLFERQFLQRQCDPIIEYLNLGDADEREGFVGVMLTRIQGLDPWSGGIALEQSDIENLRVQWEEQVQRFCEVTGFKRHG